MNTIVFCTDEMLRILRQHGYTASIGVTIATVFWQTIDGKPDCHVFRGVYGLYNWMCDCELLWADSWDGAAASWFAAATLFVKNIQKIILIFVERCDLIFYSKYDIIYIERKLRRNFICYTDKEVRIFLKNFFLIINSSNFQRMFIVF